MEDIAIVGLACRFPGEATSLKKLWEEVLTKGKSTWSEFPPDRFNIDGFHHPDNQRQGSLSFRGAHFLKEDLGTFDCSFFDMNPNDAISADPQQRKLMEVSFEALQNAGVRLEDLAGTDAGVYVASFVKDYEQITLRNTDYLPQYAATGTANSLLANRLSYFYNVSGPSMTVDTACSGSLVAVHLAAQSLRTHETSMAIVGGSNLILSPDTMFPMDQMGLLSPDGKCFTFDSRANGYGRGEGVGVVILKRLSDAIKAKDTIRAVIRGSRVNHDGRTPGITMPSKDAQARNIREVYKMAGLDVNQTGYVECHGTGTKAGDPTELAAISESLCAQRSKDNPLLVGSIKTNIGHCEGAAGVAGLIKSVLCLEKGIIPPNTNFEMPNPAIHFEDWKVKVVLEVTPWPINGPRRVSINSFGFGGTNAHVILDEAMSYLSQRGLDGIHCFASYIPSYTTYKSPGDGEGSSFDDESGDNISSCTTSCGDASPSDAEEGNISGSATEIRTPSTLSQLSTAETEETSGTGTKIVFPFSCDDKAVFSEFMASIISYLKTENCHSPHYLRDYAHTLALRSSTFKWRACVIDDTSTGLIHQLHEAKADDLVQAPPRPTALCFVFGGQGGVWAEMGRDLLCFRPFRDSLERASTFMQTRLRCPFNLIEELEQPSGSSLIATPFVSQPATTALQIALVDLLNYFGMVPQYVVGHSSGEIAAAYAASTISETQAWALAYFRGFHASELRKKHPQAQGGMIVAGMSAEEAANYLELSDSVQVACINSPSLVTLSGDRVGINMIADDLAENNIFHKVLDIPVAYHSRHMSLIASDYKASLHEIPPDTPSNGPIMFSSLHGRVADPAELDLEYWTQNLTNPVRFVDALRCLNNINAQERPGIFVEIGPSNSMRRPTLDTIESLYSPSFPPQYLSLLRTGVRGVDILLDTLGKCWARGLPVKLHEVLKMNTNFTWLGSPRHVPDVPVRPWNHSRRFWHESHLGAAHRSRSAGRKDLVGVRSLDSNAYRSTWNHFLRLRENPWIRDHQIQKTVLYPASGMVAMAIEGFGQLVPDLESLSGFYITSFTIERPMVVPESDHGLEVSMTITSLQADNFEHSFDIQSKHLGGQWQKNASGQIKPRKKSDLVPFEFAQYGSRWTSLQAKPQTIVHASQLYAAVEDQGLDYGPTFRNVRLAKVVAAGDQEPPACISTIQVPDTKARMPRQFEYPHFIHPATLDAMMQTLLAVYPTSMIPTGIDKIWISADLIGEAGVEFKGYSTGMKEGTSGALGTIAMTTKGWEVPSVVIDGARFTKMARLPVEKGGYIPLRRNLASEIVWKEDITLTKVNQLQEFLSLLAHKNAGLSILQLGLDASTAMMILNILHPRTNERCHLSRYTVSDKNEGVESLAKIRDLFKNAPVLGCIEARKYGLGSTDDFPNYNLIVANCTSVEVLEDLRKRLLPGGFLLELVGHTAANEGFGSSQSTDDGWELVDKSELVHCFSTNMKFRVHRKKPELKWKSCGEIAFLVPDKPTPTLRAMISSLRKAFQEKGAKVVTVYLSALVRLASGSTENSKIPKLVEIDGMPCVSLLSVQENFDFVFGWSNNEFEAFKYLVRKTKAILWLTRNVYRSPSNPQGSLIVGLARTLMSEDPEKEIVTFDLSCKRLGEWVPLCLEVFGRSFLTKHALGPRDVEYATGDGRLLIPRLQPLGILNQAIEGTGSDDVQEMAFSDTDSGRLNLVLKEAGATDKPTCWESLGAYKDELGPGEVEIQFHAAPLLEKDFETVFGHTTLTSMGLDVCGRITKVGGDVYDLNKGDVVVGISAQGAFQNTIRLDRGLVAKVPGNNTGLGSKFLLSCYLSAWYAIHPVGSQNTVKDKIFGDKAQSILIHDATSAHGQTAVILAQTIGFEVFVTVSHDDAKILQGLGIKESHTIFLEALPYWDGKVDMVYDPTGALFSQSAHLAKSCYSTLKQHLRTNGDPSSMQSSSSGHPDLVRQIDLRSILANKVSRLSAMDIVAQIQYKANHGALSIGAIASIETRDMGLINNMLAEAANDLPKNHILSMRATPNTRVLVSVSKEAAPLFACISSSGAYILVGAFGGVGEMIADLLVRGGAKTLVFLSRRGAESPKAHDLCDKLKKRGVQVIAYAVDVADQEALKSAWRLINRRVKVLGVVQCAAIFKDVIFDNMTYDDWVTSVRPKTIGSWNLFSIIKASSSTIAGRLRQKPWILFLSSASGVIGNRGQANYAAGNVFQDALAYHAKHHGFHATSIDFGPILGAGVLERDEGILEKLRASGFFGIQPDDFLAVVERAICGEVTKGETLPTQIVVGVGTGGIVHQNKPSDPYWSRTALYSILSRVDLPSGDLSDLSGGNAHLGGPEAIDNADNSVEGIARDLAAVLAKNMNMKVVEIDLHKPIVSFSVDSLVATAVRSRIYARTGVSVSPFDLMGDRSIDGLATMLVEKMAEKK